MPTCAQNASSAACRLPLGLRGDMRMGIALEARPVATPFTTQRSSGWLNPVALYLGGETPLGPVCIGLGRGSGRSLNGKRLSDAPPNQARRADADGVG